MDVRRIGLLSALIALLCGLLVAAPLATHSTRAREAYEQAVRAEAARMASALSPCERETLQGLTIVPATPPGQVAVTVLRFPSFSSPTAVRISGDRVERLELAWVQAGTGPAGHFEATRRDSAALSPRLTQRLVAQVRADVSQAAAPRTLGVDGTTFYFLVTGAGCGSTWSPKANSRAGRLVSAAEALTAYAGPGGGDPEPIEAALKALEHQG
jgi:hypothetical protein